MSSFTPVVTRSTNPTLPFPLPPFGLFSSAIYLQSQTSLSFRAPCSWREESASSVHLHSRQKRSRIVKLARLPLGPRVQLRGIHQNLPIRREFDMRAIHRPRRRPLEVNPFAVIAAAVAWTLEFIFAGLPVGRASQMGAARVDYEYAVRS